MAKSFSSSSVLGCAFAALILLFLVGCASFKGPGDLQAPTAAKPANATDSPAASTLTMPGEIPGEAAVSPPVYGLNFDWPVDKARLSRGFILGKHRHHWGVDLANRKGTKIVASEKGTVIYTGRGFHGYGKLIVIEHDNNWATFYAHLDKILVKEGESVDQGALIGLMGHTGHAHGTHLHFEIRHNRDPVNPLTYLPQGM